MIRRAVLIGIAAVLLIYVSFGFYLTDLELTTDARGQAWVVCNLQSPTVEPSDKYAIGFAESLGWVLRRPVRVERPKPALPINTSFAPKNIAPKNDAPARTTGDAATKPRASGTHAGTDPIWKPR